MVRRGVNIALFIGVLALLLVVYFEPGLGPPEVVKVSMLAPDKVQRVVIQARNQAPIIVQRSAGRWQLVEPVAVAANSFRIESALALLSATSYQQIAVAGHALAKFGLEEPQLRLTLDGMPILLGGQEALNYRRYLLLGDTIHLVMDKNFYLLTGPWPTFVDLQLLSGRAKLSALELPEVGRLEQVEGVWQWAGAEPLSADLLHLLVERWQQAQAVQVSAYNGGALKRSLQLTFVTGDKLRFEIVADEHELILARTDLGIQYHLPAEQVQGLLRLGGVNNHFDTPVGSEKEPDKARGE